MSVDFSHYSVTTAAMVAAYVAAGKQPYDEMLLEAFERLDPPPLSAADHQAIIKSLSRKRGSPTKVGLKRDALGGRILKMDREDMPSLFLQALADRIVAGRGLTQFDYKRSFYRQHQSRQRKNFIQGLYRLIKEQIDGGKEVHVPQVGRIEIPSGDRAASELALEMTHELMSKRFAMHPPGLRRMMNIIASK